MFCDLYPGLVRRCGFRTTAEHQTQIRAITRQDQITALRIPELKRRFAQVQRDTGWTIPSQVSGGTGGKRSWIQALMPHATASVVIALLVRLPRSAVGGGTPVDSRLATLRGTLQAHPHEGLERAITPIHKWF